MIQVVWAGRAALTVDTYATASFGGINLGFLDNCLQPAVDTARYPLHHYLHLFTDRRITLHYRLTQLPTTPPPVPLIRALPWLTRGRYNLVFRLVRLSYDPPAR